MLEIKEIGTVVASREMEFIFDDDGRKEKIFLKVGIPFEYGEGLDWCCPYELGSESDKMLQRMFGIDALQALELTMKTLSVEIQHWERSRKGKFYFLDEEGAGI
jgi:hypothetical protein